jgi:hypothetical protein
MSDLLHRYRACLCGISSTRTAIPFRVSEQKWGMTLPLDDLIHGLAAPPNRGGKHIGEFEHHFYEGAVMVAFAMHLLRTKATREVSIHPDGTHGKQFDFKRWLKGQGFTLTTPTDSTAYGGRYTRADGAVIVSSKIRARRCVGDAASRYTCSGMQRRRHKQPTHRTGLASLSRFM